jgi:hypothetical protein
MIAKVRTYDFESIQTKVEELILLACDYHDNDVVKAMKNMVPEFISKNSIYEELDALEVVSV